MHKMNARFLLVLGAFALCCFDASAAPSVRVLGTGNSITAAKTTVANSNSNTASTANTAKKASVKLNTAAAQQILKPAASGTTGSANRANTAASATTGRLPVITNKNNLQTSYKPASSSGTSIAPGISSADYAAMSSEIGEIQTELQKKANTSELENYSSKTEVAGMQESLQGQLDSLSSSVDQSLETVGSQISEINTALQGLNANNIDELRTNVEIIIGRDKTIYDHGTEAYKKVRLVGAEDFDKQEVLGITSGN